MKLRKKIYPKANRYNYKKDIFKYFLTLFLNF